MAGTGTWTGELLRELLHTGAVDTATLHTLSFDVVDLSVLTMDPFGRLSRLSSLFLTMGRTVPGGVSVPAASCLADLCLNVSPAIERDGFVVRITGTDGARIGEPHRAEMRGRN